MHLKKKPSKSSTPQRTRKRAKVKATVTETFKIDLVLLEWKDAMSSGLAWADLDQVKPELGVCVTVGYVVKETDEALMLAQNVSFTTGHFGQFMNIPRHSIQRVRRLARITVERVNG